MIARVFPLSLACLVAAPPPARLPSRPGPISS